MAKGAEFDIGSYEKVDAVVTSDTTDQFPAPGATDAFMVGADGNVVLIPLNNGAGGASVTIACKAGFVYPIKVTRFLATLTTATGIVGLRY